jgi:hypothetical protein
MGMPPGYIDVEEREAAIKQLRAQLAGAKCNLDKTIVRAPADGVVTTWRCARARALPRCRCRRQWPSSDIGDDRRSPDRAD